ncbi:ABC transporter permease [Paenibacillus hamazuiensis]|uniref:ABC transporter permease n=1 Tax=Paenibacillus hamazuiensis TaxID=2936508 RepID=UPI00200D6B2C|nr:ABC transporter permease [Paenibacillus hamazuiensis]
MQRLYASTVNEAEKLLRQRRAKFAAIVTIAVPIIAALALDGLRVSVGIDLGRDFPLWMLNLFAATLLPLFLFTAVAETFTGEHAARTVKTLLLRPVARWKLFAAKMGAIALYMALLVGILWMVSTLTGLLLNADATLRGLADNLQAYSAAFVALLSMSAIAAAIAQLFRSTTPVLACCVVLFVAAKVLPFVWPQAAVWSVFSYTDWHTLWIGSAVSAGKLAQVFVFLLSGGIIGYTTGSYLFEKQAL